jgi:predicted glycosyltransferase
MKILTYSQDTGGLGHIRRNLAVAENMASLGHDIIIVSDSIYLGKFDLPKRVDFVRIPAVTQNGDHRNELDRPF